MLGPQPRLHLGLRNYKGRAIEGSLSLVKGETRALGFEISNVGLLPVNIFSLTVVVQIYHDAVGRGKGYISTHSFPVCSWNRGRLKIITSEVIDTGDKHFPTESRMCTFDFTRLQQCHLKQSLSDGTHMP